jgi:hypothetical protein
MSAKPWSECNPLSALYQYRYYKNSMLRTYYRVLYQILPIHIAYPPTPLDKYVPTLYELQWLSIPLQNRLKPVKDT